MKNDSYFLKRPEGLKQSLFIEEMLRVLLSVFCERGRCRRCLSSEVPCRGPRLLSSPCRFADTRPVLLKVPPPLKPGTSDLHPQSRHRSCTLNFEDLQTLSRVPLISYGHVDVSGVSEKEMPQKEGAAVACVHLCNLELL